MQFKTKAVLFFCLLIARVIQAQHWCPPGATWYFVANNMYFPTDTSQPQFVVGYDKAAYTSDTIINGQTCREITDTGYYENGNTGMIIYNPVFTYSSGDTVYFLNNGVFLPCFYFGAHVGDTLRVPVGNTFVTTYVDTVGDTTINGVSLKFYTFRVPDSLYTCQSGDSLLGYAGIVIERLGFLAPDGQFDNSFSFGWSCMDYEAGYSLHCYQDDSFALYSTDTVHTCDYILTGLANLTPPTQINLYPNPTNDNCRLHLSNSTDACTAVVYDIAGREILPLFNKQRISDFDFSTSAFPPGLYFVKVVDDAGNFAIAKLIKD